MSIKLKGDLNKVKQHQPIIGAKTPRGQMLSEELRSVLKKYPYVFEKYVSSYTTYMNPTSYYFAKSRHAGSDAMPVEYIAPREPEDYACCNNSHCRCTDNQDPYESDFESYDTTEPYNDDLDVDCTELLNHF